MKSGGDKSGRSSLGQDKILAVQSPTSGLIPMDDTLKLVYASHVEHESKDCVISSSVVIRQTRRVQLWDQRRVRGK